MGRRSPAQQQRQQQQQEQEQQQRQQRQQEPRIEEAMKFSTGEAASSAPIAFGDDEEIHLQQQTQQQQQQQQHQLAQQQLSQQQQALASVQQELAIRELARREQLEQRSIADHHMQAQQFQQHQEAQHAQHAQHAQQTQHVTEMQQSPVIELAPPHAASLPSPNPELAPDPLLHVASGMEQVGYSMNTADLYPAAEPSYDVPVIDAPTCQMVAASKTRAESKQLRQVGLSKRAAAALPAVAVTFSTEQEQSPPVRTAFPPLPPPVNKTSCWLARVQDSAR